MERQRCKDSAPPFPIIQRRLRQPFPGPSFPQSLLLFFLPQQFSALAVPKGNPFFVLNTLFFPPHPSKGFSPPLFLQQTNLSGPPLEWCHLSRPNNPISSPRFLFRVFPPPFSPEPPKDWFCPFLSLSGYLLPFFAPRFAVPFIPHPFFLLSEEDYRFFS